MQDNKQIITSFITKLYYENDNIIKDLNLNIIIICSFFYNEIDMFQLIEDNFSSNDYPNFDIKLIKLVSYMFLEFYNINIELKNILKSQILEYLSAFFRYCSILDIEPNELYLKYCIMISCIDIIISLNNYKNSIYSLYDLWKNYGINTKCLKYKNKILKLFKKML